MIFFQTLFAAYYLILIKLRRNKMLRHLNRGGTEDFGAMIFVILSSFYLIILFIFFLKRIFGFPIPVIQKTSIIPRIIIILLVLVIIYFCNKYFISDRARRNKFIENFREFNVREKLIWNLIAIFLMLIPVWYLIFLIIKKR